MTGTFPHVIWGRCPVCGGKGDDYASVSSADATPTENAGDGVPLEYYKGKLMCEVCHKRLQADAESMASARKITDRDKFLDRAGFKKSIE